MRATFGDIDECIEKINSNISRIKRFLGENAIHTLKLEGIVKDVESTKADKRYGVRDEDDYIFIVDSILLLKPYINELEMIHDQIGDITMSSVDSNFILKKLGEQK